MAPVRRKLAAQLPSMKFIVYLPLVALLTISCSGSNDSPTNDDDPENNLNNNNETSGTDQENQQVEPLAPLENSITQVTFNIEVPSYQSNTLQVQLNWGEQQIPVIWVSDEYWSATSSLPTDTSQLLTITFFDRNGSITLGQYQALYKTGTQITDTVSIQPEQFNTSIWDTDGDSVSNIDELIAGSYSDKASHVLLFSETRGFRHESIDDALQALQEIAVNAGIQTSIATDSENFFTSNQLANYDAVVWVLTSGDVLNAEEQIAFESFIKNNGGFMGIHAASDTEYDWPWYGELVGAYFNDHPAIQTATLVVENLSHPSTSHLDQEWIRTDEWYDFQSNPRSRVNVLISLDENTYNGGGMGDDHPIAWYHKYDGGRSWYTGGGHTKESYYELAFREHLLGGIQYVLGND